jgi:hypothetical protein
MTLAARRVLWPGGGRHQTGGLRTSGKGCRRTASASEFGLVGGQSGQWLDGRKRSLFFVDDKMVRAMCPL